MAAKPVNVESNSLSPIPCPKRTHTFIQCSQKTIFIGGFSSATDSQAIFTAFSPFGDIIDVQLPPDPSHRKFIPLPLNQTKMNSNSCPFQNTEASHRGFAFVTYVDATSATDAIDNMHQNVLPGSSNLKRVLKVNLAKPSKGIAVGGSNRAMYVYCLSASAFC